MASAHKVLLVHPTGNEFVRNAVRGLAGAGLLESFHTTVAWNAESRLSSVLPTRITAELRRRSYQDIPRHLIVQHPLLEMARLSVQRLPRAFQKLSPSVTAIYSALDAAAARAVSSGKDIGAVYAYEDGARSVFTEAKERGLARIYDLPIGYWRAYHRILNEEKELRPEWRGTLAGIDDSQEKLHRKDEEIALAGCVIVASTFTANTLKDYPVQLDLPIYKIGYGSPAPATPRVPQRGTGPLKVLYAGSIGQRKGIAYLLEAMTQLAIPCALTLLGRPVARVPVLEAALQQHTWIASVDHPRMLEIMRENDVLVLPSLFEGYGLVLTEAMAQGTVVIATPHTAAPDIIEDGVNGFIVPIRSAEAIAAALTRLGEDRHLLAAMSEASIERVRSLTWENYQSQLIQAVRHELAIEA